MFCSRRKRKSNITSVFTQTHVSVENRMIREHTSHNGNINNINNHPSYFRLVNFYHDVEEDKTVTSLRLDFSSSLSLPFPLSPTKNTYDDVGITEMSKKPERQPRRRNVQNQQFRSKSINCQLSSKYSFVFPTNGH